MSKLKDFETPDVKLEQYSTPSEIAADVVWQAFMHGDIKDKIVLDAACGPGYFGIAALLLGAKKVFFVDISKEAIDLLHHNLEYLPPIEGKHEVIHHDIRDFSYDVDVVLQNPPFGIQGEKHTDKLFLEQACRHAPVVYSMHKLESDTFIRAVAKDHHFSVTHCWPYDFPLPKTQYFHTQRKHIIRVGCWRMEKA